MQAGDSEMEISKLLEDINEDGIQSMIDQAGWACRDEVREEFERISVASH